MEKSQAEAGDCTLLLLDSAHGQPIQTWQFHNRAQIRIGRADETDVTLADTQVSRVHVEIVYQDGGWVLISLGRNGTRVDGVAANEAKLADRSIFQLGASGPTFRFLTSCETVGSLGTIDDVDFKTLELLMVDERRKAEEVQQITDSEAFRLLQEQARRLRISKNVQEEGN